MDNHFLYNQLFFFLNQYHYNLLFQYLLLYFVCTEYRKQKEQEMEDHKEEVSEIIALRNASSNNDETDEEIMIIEEETVELFIEETVELVEEQQIAYPIVKLMFVSIIS